jgi:mRNA interferase MazF
MPSTTSYQPGDLVLVEFPFTGSGTKLRPALVVLDSGDADVLMARVTTQHQATPYDIQVTDWRQAGLLAPSFIRLHKLATLSKARIQRRLGALELWTAGKSQGYSSN